MYMQTEMMCAPRGCAPSTANQARLLERWAKVELLKEKVKQRIDAKFGSKLDRLADLIVEVVAEEANTSEQLDRKEEQMEDAFDELGA